MSSNIKPKSPGAKESPTEPFKRAVTGCVRAIARKPDLEVSFAAERPGIVGGKPGKYALMSEVCGVDSAVPDRDRTTDIFPMKYDMVIIAPGAREVKVWNQLHG